ncbi:MAG: AAA family ATPase [candidate division NC10 bacterium]|nr:AAA family ATPase [candidate division NC10 bacterium]
MFLDYWGLVKEPFVNVPDPDFLFPSPKHGEALMRLLYVIQGRKGAAILTGDIGCGKTLVSRTLVRELPPQRYDVAVVTSPILSPVQFLREIIYQFEGDKDDRAVQRVDSLHAMNRRMISNYQSGKDTIIIIDEAHLIIEKKGILEELRLLLNFQLNDRFLLTLILIGQLDLEEKIKRVPALEQRIVIKYRLLPLTEQETAEYISFRSKKAGAQRELFSGEALQMIYHLAEGTPRRINNLCDLCLLIGFAEKAALIDEKIVHAALAGVC